MFTRKWDGKKERDELKLCALSDARKFIFCLYLGGCRTFVGFNFINAASMKRQSVWIQILSNHKICVRRKWYKIVLLLLFSCRSHLDTRAVNNIVNESLKMRVTMCRRCSECRSARMRQTDRNRMTTENQFRDDIESEMGEEMNFYAHSASCVYLARIRRSSLNGYVWEWRQCAAVVRHLSR